MTFGFDWKKVILYSFVCLIVPALFIGYWTSGSSDKQIQLAKEAFDLWKHSPSDLALEKKMRKALNNTPHLKKALQAEIVQTLLSNGSSEAVEIMGAHCLRQLEKEAPLHAHFAQTSFLIEKRQYQNALEQAVSLKEKIESAKETDRRAILYTYNLLRIAFLQKQLANQSGELAAWEEIKSLLEGTGSRSEATQLLEANFQKRSGKKSFSLSDFISQRERLLTAP
ncbi:MAG TPA: hypothetical protein VGM34_00845 [Chlamydiales bacterium]|jgi:hypothetical protein